MREPDSFLYLASLACRNLLADLHARPSDPLDDVLHQGGDAHHDGGS